MRNRLNLAARLTFALGLGAVLWAAAGTALAQSSRPALDRPRRP